MNCEKFESLLLDELYGELDELTSAAMRKHALSCAQCGPQLDGFRRTRAAFQQYGDVELPSSLEAGILGAIVEAEKATSATPDAPVVPIATRNSGWVSRAGRWAMRPQTAMAALFMLMLGSSAVLMRSRQTSDKRAVSVEEMGSPEAKPANAPANAQERARAFGAGAASAMPTSAPKRGMSGRAEGMSDDEAKEPRADGKQQSKDKSGGESEPAAEALGMPPPPSLAPGQAGAAPANMNGVGSLGGAQGAESTNADGRGTAEENQNLSRGLEQYRNRDFDNARRTFQTEATKDPNAALWAARSAREGSGKCNVAVKEFDKVAKRAQGTAAGDQAALESAKCLRAMGANAEADARLRSIQNSPTVGKTAKAELEANANRAGTATATKAAPAAPAVAPAKPSASGSNTSDNHGN